MTWHSKSNIFKATPEMRLYFKKRKTQKKFLRWEKIQFDKIIGSGVSMKEIAQFTRQLATLLEARLPLAMSLEILANQASNLKLQQIIRKILLDIKEGKSLSNSMKRYPHIFNDLYISLIKVGEHGGILEQTLSRLATYLEKMVHLHRKIRSAMAYPLVVIFVAIGAVTFLLAGVVPTFAELFQDFGSQLPAPTQWMLTVGSVIKTHFWLPVLICLGIWLLLKKIKKNEKVACYFERLSLSIPLIGGLIRKNFLAKFCQTLGTLLNCGVSLLTALEVTGYATTNKIFIKAIQNMKDRIVRGRSLIDLQSIDEPFTLLIAQMIRIGEETGTLDFMLLKVAKSYEEELDASIEALTSIIEPVIIVVLGVILGGILIAMYLQIFDLVNVIQ
ncbi:MAG: type II secretion system F family protein [Calditrichaeota bacterium]|nr:MAG: type II secretion system F family protein [Calditrichota bacterium]